jgi:hypothetical protein
MPPNSPTEKSPNGSDGMANGPIGEQPRYGQRGCSDEHPNTLAKPPSGHHNTMTNRSLAKVPDPGMLGVLRAPEAYFLINDRSTYCMIPPLR